jgi:hypothetical protein
MISNTIKRTSKKYMGKYRGVVEDTADPLTLGRVRIRIRPMMHNSTIVNDALPWAVPAFPIHGGAGSGFGFFAVPRVGAEVWVFFEMGDPMQPVYFAEASNGVKGLPAGKDTDYPYSVVWQTEDGHIFYVDRTRINITHKSGTTINIDAEGSVVVSSEKDVGISAKGNVNVMAMKNVSVIGATAVNLYSSTELSIGAPIITIDGLLKVNEGLMADLCTSLTGWSPAGVGSVAVSSLNGLSTFKFLSGAAGVGAFGGISKVLGTLTDKFTMMMKFNPSSLLGNFATNNIFQMAINQPLVQNAITFARDGLFVHDGIGFQNILPSIGSIGAFSDWKFVVNNLVPGSSAMDIIKDGVTMASGVNCSKVGSYVGGLMDFKQLGQTVANVQSNIGFIKVLSGI